MKAIWTNADQEESLREQGYTIPVYPTSGAVLNSAGRKVGHIDNFSGISTDDEQLIADCRAIKAAVWTVL